MYGGLTEVVFEKNVVVERKSANLKPVPRPISFTGITKISLSLSC